MIKALLKKQFIEFFSMMFSKRNSKVGKNSKGTLLLFIILFIYLFGFFAVIFYRMGVSLCKPLHPIGLDWLYFSLIGFMSIMLDIMFTAFSAGTQIFTAKDNELLLSLPIQPSKIVFSRISALYILTFVYNLIFMVPVYIAYINISGTISALSIVLFAITMFLMPLISVGLSCIIGWVISLILSKINNKSIISVVISIVFLSVYFYVYYNINGLIKVIVQNTAIISDKAKIYLYPLYQMGLAIEGKLISFLIFTAIALTFFGIIYYIISHNFIKIATVHHSSSKVKYKEKVLKVRSAENSLLCKELIHFKSSAPYMLNCSLSSILLLAATVFAVIKSSSIRLFLDSISPLKPLAALIICAVICFMVSMNIVTTPSISLEGKSLWILQSSPIKIWDVFKSKINLHLVVTLPPAFIAAVVTNLIVGISILDTILVTLTIMTYTLFTAVAGLVIGLKKPYLNWTNETVVIKQSMSVFISMMINFGILTALIIAFVLLHSFLSAELFCIISMILFAGLSALLIHNLKTEGVLKFISLS